MLLDPKSQFQPKDAAKFTVDTSATVSNGTKSSESTTTFGKFEEKDKSEAGDVKVEEERSVVEENPVNEVEKAVEKVK